MTPPRTTSPSTASDRGRRHADEVAITFAKETGKGFYDQIEDAVEAHDEAPFFDFHSMPADWTVPEPTPEVASAPSAGGLCRTGSAHIEGSGAR